VNTCRRPACEPGVLNQLELMGTKIPRSTRWCKVPDNVAAVICRKPWENCRGISLIATRNEEEFESFKADEKTVAIILLPLEQIPFFFGIAEEIPVADPV